jgi:hypothetical protein
MDWQMILLEKDVIKAGRMNYDAQIGLVTKECNDDNFPCDMIKVRGGIVVKQVQLLDNPNCSTPDVRGWYIEQLVEWLTDDKVPAPLHIIKWEE